MQLAAFLGNPTVPQPSPVANYLDDLARDMAFDPALSRRVRLEVEDHLREAAMAEFAESTTDAENRAIIKFGAPEKLVSQYRAASLHKRMKRTGLLVLCAILVAFGSMESRAVWYRLTGWDVDAHLKSIGETILPIDRWAFAFAIALGIVGSLYVISRPISVTYGPSSRARTRCGQFLIAAAIGATTIAVACEAILTACRLAEAHWPTRSVLPVISIILEIAIVLAAVAYIRNIVRRASLILGHTSRRSGSGEA